MSSIRGGQLGQLGVSAAAVGEFTLPGYGTHYAPDLGLEPTHLELHLAVDLPKRTAVGEAIWTLAARRSNETQLILDAVEIQVEHVADVEGRPLTWRHDGRKLFIHWADSTQKGESRRVSIQWHVSSPRSGMFFGGGDGSWEQTEWMATDHETERARYWLPCIDQPNVRTALDVHLRARTDYARVTAGLLVDETVHDDGTTTSHWRLEQRCPSYLFCLLVGELTAVDGGEHNGVPIRFYAPKPYTEADLTRSFGPTADMMAWMTDRLGVPFPYPKYFQFAAPGIGGAMENISLTSWDDAFVADDRFYGERGWLIDLINLHEMAHSYFGDAVVCRDYAHAWLKEGWATYMESVWLGDTVGLDALHHQMYEESIAYRQEADNRYLRPIVTRDFNSSFQMYDGHLYPGAAWRIHMLRHMLGDEDFWAAVKNYLVKYSGEVVETDDFRYELEAVSGRSLARFFDQWIHSSGYPQIKVTYAYDTPSRQVRVQVEQTQMGERKGVTVNTFDFDVEVGIQGADGQWSTHTLAVSSAKHTLVASFSEAPLQVIIDPDLKLLHRLEFNPGDDFLCRSVGEAPTIYGRIQAAIALAEKPSQRGIEAIEKAYESESQWGVRIAFARALGSSASTYGMHALNRILLSESDPRVMNIVATACGQYRDPAVARALTHWLKRSEQPYLAQGAALKSLGAQRGKEHLPVLKAAAEDDSWWGWVRRDAHIALGNTREGEAFHFLLETLRRGSDLPQVQMMTALGLAEACQWLTDAERAQAMEAITDSTAGQGLRYCVTAARALVILGNGSAVGSIETIGQRLATQWAHLFGKCAQDLRAKASGTRGADEGIAELKATIQTLTARIDALEAQQKERSKA